MILGVSLKVHYIYPKLAVFPMKMIQWIWGVRCGAAGQVLAVVCIGHRIGNFKNVFRLGGFSLGMKQYSMIRKLCSTFLLVLSFNFRHLTDLNGIKAHFHSFHPHSRTKAPRKMLCDQIAYTFPQLSAASPSFAKSYLMVWYARCGWSTWYHTVCLFSDLFPVIVGVSGH